MNIENENENEDETFTIDLDKQKNIRIKVLKLKKWIANLESHDNKSPEIKAKLAEYYTELATIQQNRNSFNNQSIDTIIENNKKHMKRLKSSR